MRGTAQNPDVFFQAREAANPYMLAVKGIVKRGHGRAGRAHRSTLRPGDATAARRTPSASSSSWAPAPAPCRRPWRRSSPAGEKVGHGPGPALPALPGRGAGGGPAVHRALHRRARPLQGAGRHRRALLPRDRGRHRRGHRQRRGAPFAARPRIIGGRYGLSSKEFTPSMVKPIFDELATDSAEAPLHGRHLRRRHQPEPAHRPRRSCTRVRRARCRPCSSASAPTAPWAPTRPRSRSSARAPTSSPRVTSCTTPRSRAR